jgi:DNA-binding beta-propeller fold protein YncE
MTRSVMRWLSGWRALTLIALLLLGVGTAGAVIASAGNGVIGPANMIQPTGRQLHPDGTLVTLGNFPSAGALTPNGRFLWTISSGRGRNDIRIVALSASGRSGRVIQNILMPGLDGGVAIAPDGRTAYVSGIPGSSYTDEAVPPSIPGAGGDVISVLNVNPSTGIATRDGVIAVPPPPGAPAEQAFPPVSAKASWPLDLAVSPDGKTLLAALNLADAAAVINTQTRGVSYVSVGHYPFGAAITSDGRYGLVTSETQGTVSVIDLSSDAVVQTLQVGPHLSDSEGIAVDPKAPLAFVANANEDVIAVINTAKLRVQGMLSLMRPQGNGTTPTAVSVTGDGCDLLSADSGEDAVAVFALSRAPACNAGRRGARAAKQFALVGRIPVASDPTFAAASSVHAPLVWIAANGVGVGANPKGPNPDSPLDSNDFINSFQYLPSIVRGDAGVLPFPSDATIRSLTPVADRELVPTDTEKPPAGTPIRAGGPIKHVFLIVKENRTYDQVFGDIKRGDGDPKLTLFGASVTPNEHALVARFPLLDHVYADSQVSIDGHYWTSSGAVPDYVVRNWPPNYAGRGRPLDFGAYEVSAPVEGTIFDRALAQGISFYNYGEAFANLAYILPDKDRTPAELSQQHAVAAGSDVQLFGGGPVYAGGPSLPACYDSEDTIFSPFGQPNTEIFDSAQPAGAPAGSHSRYACFLARFEQQVAHDAVPAINYMVLPLDHTEGVVPGGRTPDADVADNDWALGQIVQTISHSSIWKSSLILVLEDDAQDGADHVDAHRIPVLVISPYARKGAVIHDRYDQLSFLRTLEIVTGIRPANLAEALAVPLYDAFSRAPSDSAPYNAIAPAVSVTATNPDTAANRDVSAGLNLNMVDQVPEQQLDAILWRYVHGAASTPPPPGPDAASISAAAASAEDQLLNPDALLKLLRDWKPRRG